MADGDTISVLDYWKSQYKVRLQDIDAPERGQPYAKASKKHLARLVAGKFVVVEYKKHDWYGRIVGKVLLSDEDVNLKQIEAGARADDVPSAHLSKEIGRTVSMANEKAPANMPGPWSLWLLI